MNTIMLSKSCTKCNLEKTLDEYNKSFSGCLYGVASICKNCMVIRRREKTLIKNEGTFCIYPVPQQKKCTTCGIEKENITENFRLPSRIKKMSSQQLLFIHPHNRLSAQCKDCEANLQKINSQTEERKQKSRQWKRNNKDRINQRNRELHQEKLKDPKYVKQYKAKIKKRYAENRHKFLKISQKYRENNREKTRESTRKYYWNNRERVTKRASEWRRRVKYSSSRRKKDPIYKLKCECRGRINWLTNRRSKVIKYNQSCPQTEKLIGCSVEFYYLHIEKQFLENMSWNNYGEWHVDHIIPLATAKTEEQVLSLNKWSNLQPLWSTDNIKKGSKILESAIYDYFVNEISE